MILLRLRFFLERWRERRASRRCARRIDRMLRAYDFAEVAPGDWRKPL